MIGTIRINIIIGAIAFFINILFSYGHNLFTTVLLRSLMAFGLFFLLSYLLRFILAMIIESSQSESDQKIERGRVVDLTTPDEINVPDRQKETEFIPLVHTIKEKTPSLEHDPTDIANAIRKVMNSD